MKYVGTLYAILKQYSLRNLAERQTKQSTSFGPFDIFCDRNQALEEAQHMRQRTTESGLKKTKVQDKIYPSYANFRTSEPFFTSTVILSVFDIYLPGIKNTPLILIY